MADPRFFDRAGPFKLGELAARIEATPVAPMDPGILITDVAPLDTAGPGDLSHLSHRRYAELLAATKATACLVTREAAGRVPPGTIALVSADPARSHAKAAALLYPAATPAPGIDPRAIVDPSAKIGAKVTIGPGVVIGARAELGARTIIGPNSVIGPGCAIGADCIIGANVSIAFSLIGDRVIIHPGACLGQDGFGFVMGAGGHMKVPQLGRVIVQDDVEIGACTTIDRGAGPDTVVGQGTKIDNQVQIGHNVQIGRGCVLAGQAGISGSVVIGDFVAIGGQAGFADHVKIGDGAQIAASCGVMRDIPPRTVWAGAPARPIKQFMREVALLAKLAQSKRSTDE